MLFPAREVIAGAAVLAVRAFAGIDRSIRDPLLEVLQDRVGKTRLSRRHLEIRIAVADRGEEEAFLRLARHEGRTRVPSAQDHLTVIETQTTLGLARFDRMAFVTMLGEDGADLRLEMGRVGGGRPLWKSGDREETPQMDDACGSRRSVPLP